MTRHTMSFVNHRFVRIHTTWTRNNGSELKIEARRRAEEYRMWGYTVRPPASTAFSARRRLYRCGTWFWVMNGDVMGDLSKVFYGSLFRVCKRGGAWYGRSRYWMKVVTGLLLPTATQAGQLLRRLQDTNTVIQCACVSTDPVSLDS